MMLTVVMIFVSRSLGVLGARFKKSSTSSRVWHGACFVGSTFSHAFSAFLMAACFINLMSWSCSKNMKPIWDNVVHSVDAGARLPLRVSRGRPRDP